MFFINMSALVYEESVELRHDADDVIVHFRQPLYDGLRFPPAKIAKGYLGNDLAVTLELAREVDGRAFRYSALVANVPPPKINRKLQGPRRGDDYQFSVLVDNVEVMDSKEHRLCRIRASVWLKALDEVANSGVCDSLYFSFIHGEHVRRGWWFFENGKFNEPNVLAPVLAVGKMPDDVIEARSKMVNDLPGEDTESKGNRTLSVILNRLRNELLIVITEEGVFAVLKKTCDLHLKITDVLVGPI